jgi:sirohydrochlorin ferrochelatase
MRVLLVDNGSLRAASVLNLRGLADRLGQAIGHPVIAASLLHSNRIPKEQLGGEPAINVERRIRLDLQAGERRFVILPLFFGPTAAIIDYLPQRIAFLRELYGDFTVTRAPFLFTGDAEADALLVDILEARLLEQLEDCQRPAKVALVDHGSPLPVVTAVRDALAQALARRMDGKVTAVAAASMERRDGPEYAFNEPLLETLLRRDEWREAEVVVSMLFLSPGRHAGADGDVATICAQAEAECPRLRTRMTGLVATHPLMDRLLLRRWEQPGIAM